jgi:hypothetical protein
MAMSKIVKAGAALTLLLSGATYVLAQAQNPNAEQRPFPPDGTNTQPYDKNKEPTNAPEAGVGSRPMGPPASEAPVTGKPADVAPETPADKNTTDLKKLDKQGRGGQTN